MTLHIELSPDEELRLRIEASQHGIDAAEFARQAVLERVTAQQRKAPVKLEMPEGGAAARRALRQWLEEDRTDDPAELAEAERERAEFKAQMNANRVGEEPLFVLPV